MPLATPAQIFDRIDRAQSAWTRGEASISTAETGPQGTTKAQFRLDLDGAGGATLHVVTPAQGRSAATDQLYVLRGAVATGYDLSAGERLSRPAPDRGSVGLRFTAVLGGLNDAVGFLTASEVRNRYLIPLRTLEGWKTTPTGLVRRTTTSGKTSLTRLDLDATGRLRALHVELPNSRVDWTITYGPYRPFVAPRISRVVDAFTARPRPPHYADARAQRAGDRTLFALGRLQSGVVKIDGTTTLAFDGRRVRFDASGIAYAYDGRVLTVVTPGAAYRGPCSRGAVIDEVASTAGAVDPLARSVLVRTAPFAELFPPEAKLRLVGTMAASGQPCDVLEIDGPRFRASIFARKSDGLPLSVESTALDNRGGEVATTRRNLQWSSVGRPVARATFSIAPRSGQKVLPLPKRSATTAP